MVHDYAPHMNQTNIFVDGTRNSTKDELMNVQDDVRSKWVEYAQLRKEMRFDAAKSLYNEIQKLQKRIDELIVKLTCL